MNFDTILQLPSASARVTAVLSSPIWWKDDATADAMNRAARLSPSDIARYGGENPAFRKPAHSANALVSHSTAFAEGLLSEPCAECVNAVSRLGLSEDALPIIAQAYELLFENSKGSPELPDVPVWMGGSTRDREADFALDALLGKEGKFKPASGGGYGTGVPHSVPGYAREELRFLLYAINKGAFSGMEAPLSDLGVAREIALGDLLRIALFIGFARMVGITASQTSQVRELAVKAIVANR